MKGLNYKRIHCWKSEGITVCGLSTVEKFIHYMYPMEFYQEPPDILRLVHGTCTECLNSKDKELILLAAV